MSLLSRGNTTVKVYPEVTATDRDGNTITRASDTAQTVPAGDGTDFRASVQPLTNTETANAGFETVTKYRLRLVDYPGVLGAQAQVEWQGKRYSIDGDARQFVGSTRTAHVEYTMTRK